MDQIPVVVPIIHMNGDNLRTLVVALENAFDAVRDAIEALRQTAPNGRNFYPQPGLMDEAIAQHDTRMRRLREVCDSLEAEAIAIQKHIKEGR